METTSVIYDHVHIKRCKLDMLGGSNAPDRPLCAFTVDVEDWYQSCIDYDAPITERVIRNVDRVLALLDECGVTATFFVQGLVAEAFPEMLRNLMEGGHEIQSHGYSHRPLYRMNRDELRIELERSRKSVEDACGVRVTAFRAPDFSIQFENLWALEELVDAGFEIDSSIFPLRTRRYGIPRWEIAPHRIQLPNGAEILEVPVAIWRGRISRLSIAGGGYFRLLPQALLRRGLSSIIANRRPPVVYCHPYEFNPNELDDYHSSISPFIRYSQGVGRTRFVEVVRNLLGLFPFGRFDHVLEAWGVV